MLQDELRAATRNRPAPGTPSRSLRRRPGTVTSDYSVLRHQPITPTMEAFAGLDPRGDWLRRGRQVRSPTCRRSRNGHFRVLRLLGRGPAQPL